LPSSPLRDERGLVRWRGRAALVLGGALPSSPRRDERSYTRGRGRHGDHESAETQVRVLRARHQRGFDVVGHLTCSVRDELSLAGLDRVDRLDRLDSRLSQLDLRLVRLD
jgi:hypothetical protein